MSGVNDWSEAERDLFAVGSRAALDDLERYREELNSGYAPDTTATDEMVKAHNARMRQLEEDHKAWLARFINGETDEPAPTHELAGADRASVPGGTPNGHRPQQPDPDPYAAELAEAERIRTMPMQDWAEVRKTLIRTSDGLFG